MSNQSKRHLVNETEVAYFIKYVTCKRCYINYERTPTRCTTCQGHDFEEFDLYVEKVK